MRKCKLKYTAVDTKKDGVKFRTVQLKSLGEQYNTLHDDYKEAQQALAAEVMKVVGTVSKPLLICHLSHRGNAPCSWIRAGAFRVVRYRDRNGLERHVVARVCQLGAAVCATTTQCHGHGQHCYQGIAASVYGSERGGVHPERRQSD